MRDHRLSISTVSCGISRTGVLEARKQKERDEISEWSSHGRPVAAGQVTGRKRDPIIRSGLRRADRGYHKSRLTVGKIFAARATGRDFSIFHARMYAVYAYYIRRLSGTLLFLLLKMLAN